MDRAFLVKEIYQLIGELGEKVTNDQKALVDRFVKQYSRVPKKQVQEIKRETKMDYIGATITEHHELIGEARGEARGKESGKEIGKVEGRIAMLYDMKNSGLIDENHFQALLGPLELELEKLEEKDKNDKQAVLPQDRAS